MLISNGSSLSMYVCTNSICKQTPHPEINLRISCIRFGKLYSSKLYSTYYLRNTNPVA